MSTTVDFAGHRAEEPELGYTHDRKPCVSCRDLVNRRVQNTAGERANDELTPLNVEVYGSAASHMHDSCGCGDPIKLHGLECTETWPAKGTGEKPRRPGPSEDRY